MGGLRAVTCDQEYTEECGAVHHCARPQGHAPLLHKCRCSMKWDADGEAIVCVNQQIERLQVTVWPERGDYEVRAWADEAGGDLLEVTFSAAAHAASEPPEASAGS